MIHSPFVAGDPEHVAIHMHTTKVWTAQAEAADCLSTSTGGIALLSELRPRVPQRLKLTTEPYVASYLILPCNGS